MGHGFGRAFFLVSNYASPNILRFVLRTDADSPYNQLGRWTAVVEGVASGYWPPPAKRSSGFVSH
jgi:hypothetical protein